MTMNLDEISNAMHAVSHQYAHGNTYSIFVSCLLQLPYKDAEDRIKCCRTTYGPNVIDLLREFSEEDDVSNTYVYFIGVTERWTEKNPYVMDMG